MLARILGIILPVFAIVVIEGRVDRAGREHDGGAVHSDRSVAGAEMTAR
jgi:hypothetical protein